MWRGKRRKSAVEVRVTPDGDGGPEDYMIDGVGPWDERYISDKLPSQSIEQSGPTRRERVAEIITNFFESPRWDKIDRVYVNLDTRYGSGQENFVERMQEIGGNVVNNARETASAISLGVSMRVEGARNSGHRALSLGVEGIETSESTSNEIEN